MWTRNAGILSHEKQLLSTAVRFTRVLFLCTHYSARSQMAEGMLRELGAGAIEVHSAGTVATQVRPEAIAVMTELEIDISEQWSKTLEEYVDQHFNYVIAVCDIANESCPIFSNAQHWSHWSIDDPSGVAGSDDQRLAAFRTARDTLIQRLQSELLPALQI